MKMDRPTLIKAMRDLDRIQRAGYLEELQADVCHYTRHLPSDTDLENTTIGRRIEIEQLARVGSKLLRVPLADALVAATEASCKTRQRITLAVIESWIRRLNGTTPAVRTPGGTPAVIQRQTRKAK